MSASVVAAVENSSSESKGVGKMRIGGESEWRRGDGEKTEQRRRKNRRRMLRMQEEEVAVEE